MSYEKDPFYIVDCIRDGASVDMSNVADLLNRAAGDADKYRKLVEELALLAWHHGGKPLRRALGDFAKARPDEETLSFIRILSS